MWVPGARGWMLWRRWSRAWRSRWRWAGPGVKGQRAGVTSQSSNGALLSPTFNKTVSTQAAQGRKIKPPTVIGCMFSLQKQSEHRDRKHMRQQQRLWTAGGAAAATVSCAAATSRRTWEWHTGSRHSSTHTATNCLDVCQARLRSWKSR